MKIPTSIYRKLALVSYLLLLIWVPIWHLLLANPTGRSEQFEIFLTFVWTIPLLLPMSGILRGKPYTHAWANFIVMFYIMHGLTSFYAVENERYYALIEIVLSVGMFIGCSFYARLRGKELGLSIPKLKDEMAKEKATFGK
ncbi:MULTISPECIES: DUF2069 domain-containing protein [Alteromonadaceae]|uniref:DUF2069 domain-containing protein n=1 Tax=Alteromonadaceae TaxID=72275 RepID=UPI001C0A04E1|nr:MULTISPECIES: DUF2069 domain-containing protein [Aliiglaciecola]MBU2877150.1 DUF2069 domain-containing protein [Aliiglaciecola lipolytica]MDO6712080.1 DUF2069 domain-containing protein [Aliiglaciecola sp. 2_MG-2023]MDO6753160.1 DUF2069 domain-containing protein [Aliiglaciecola sp. 1_MG-2023]